MSEDSPGGTSATWLVASLVGLSIGGSAAPVVQHLQRRTCQSEGECENVCVWVCVSAFPSPLLLPFPLPLSSAPAAHPLSSLSPSLTHSQWVRAVGARGERKARSWQQEQRREAEAKAAAKEKGSRSRKIKVTLLSFLSFLSFPLLLLRNRDKTQLEEVGGCREAGLPGKAGGGNLLLPGRG